MAGHAFDRSAKLCLDGQIARESIHPVAAGGCADVWDGLFGNRKVAIKVARPFESTGRRMEQDKLLRRVWREYLAWSCLSHPNVLECLGFSHDFSPEFYLLPSLISPWMSNGTVISYIQNNPKVDRLEILLGVAEGLSYLHARDPVLVHGDLRAGNILISDRGVPCLSDFGLSRVLSEIRGMTTSAELAGTLRWMSPELLLADGKVSVYSDIWAYGMTVLEILSGERPYATVKNDIFILCELRDGRTPSRPTNLQVLEGLSDALWSICQFCWTLEPTARPSMREVTSTLQSLSSPPPDQSFLKPRNTCQPSDQAWSHSCSDPHPVPDPTGVRDESASLSKLQVDNGLIDPNIMEGRDPFEREHTISDSKQEAEVVGEDQIKLDCARPDMDTDHMAGNNTHGSEDCADIGTHPCAKGTTAETIFRSPIRAVARGDVAQTTYKILAFEHGITSSKLSQEYEDSPKRVTSIWNESPTIIHPPPSELPEYSEFPHSPTPEPNMNFGRVVLLGVPYTGYGQKRSNGRTEFYRGPSTCNGKGAHLIRPGHQWYKLMGTGCRTPGLSHLRGDHGERTRKNGYIHPKISRMSEDGVWQLPPPPESRIVEQPWA